jgi:hypothetical protein
MEETVVSDEVAAQGAAAVRRCAGVCEGDGAPCRSRRVGEDGWCFAHRPGARAELAQRGRQGGLVSGQVRREQAKSVRDRLREKVEAEADEIWRVYRDAFDATDSEGDSDHRARLASVEGVLAQAYGKPAQAIVGDAEQPVTFVLASLLQRARDEQQ